MRSSSPLADRTVVGTGLAHEIARRGAQVALLSHEKAALEAVAESLPGQIASLASIGAAPLLSSYGASKAGAEAFAHAYGQRWHTGASRRRAYLNWTDTDMIRNADRFTVLREPPTHMPRPARRCTRRKPSPPASCTACDAAVRPCTPGRPAGTRSLAPHRAACVASRTVRAGDRAGSRSRRTTRSQRHGRPRGVHAQALQPPAPRKGAITMAKQTKRARETSGRGKDRRLTQGDEVTWNSHGSTTEGTVERKITRRTEAAGRTVDASPDDPQYEVRSARSDRPAVHKPSALRKK